MQLSGLPHVLIARSLFVNVFGPDRTESDKRPLLSPP
jgi:hypothetical protein